MKYIKTEDAVGQVLCHDITQIIRGVTKNAQDILTKYGFTIYSDSSTSTTPSTSK